MGTGNCRHFVIFTFAFYFLNKKRRSFCMTHTALTRENDVIVYLINERCFCNVKQLLVLAYLS